VRVRSQAFSAGRPPWWDDNNDRAMLICRISDKKQKDGVSLEAQEHHGREYVNDRPNSEETSHRGLRREVAMLPEVS